MAPVYRALIQSQDYQVELISTGQHREMSRQALSAFELTADVELDLMSEGQSLGQFASRALASLNEHFARTSPSVVLVQGDTTTTVMASLAAFYHRTRIGHIEAGMRTGDRYSPWPEEMNRRLTADLANWHFVPVQRNQDNLVREGISADTCFVTGNTVLDSLLWMRNRLRSNPIDLTALRQRLAVSIEFFERFFIGDGRCVLVTCHRRETHGQGLRDVCQAIRKLSNLFPDVGFYFPVHPNPQVSQIVNQELAEIPSIALGPPLDYVDFVWVMDRCYMIISDSGGIQGEGMSLNKPVLVTRENTEYTEAVECGGCQLVGTNPNTICRIASELLVNHTEYQRRAMVENPYGDGQAGQKVVQFLRKHIT